MFHGLLTASRAVRFAPIAGLGLAAAQCGGAGDASPVGVSRAAIVGGTTVGDPRSPVLLLREPQGFCTGALVAPNLVATVRHCVSPFAEGSFACTPGGALVLSGSPAGQMGAVYAADQITFLTSTSVATRDFATAPPDAVGARIVATSASSVCSDDLAFVVLASPIVGLTPLPVRLAPTTETGESVSVWGYGFTQQAADPTALRVASAILTAIGPSTPTTLAQGAPLRAARLGPGTATCNGDSGAPVTSNATGALLSVISLGPVASTRLSCPIDGNASSTGPLLSDYTALVLAAFAAAGASPNLETVDAMAPPAPDAAGAPDANAADGNGETAPSAGYRAEGSSCAAAVALKRGMSAAGVWSFAAACAAAVVRRRRR